MFDITKYKFSDKAICLLKGDECFALTNDKQITLATGQTNWINFNKKDVMALAKHFNLLNESVDTVITNSILENIETEDILPKWDADKGEIIDGFGTIYDIVETDTSHIIEIGKMYQSNETPNISFMKRIPQSETTYKSLNLDSVKEIFNKEDDLHG